MYCNRESFMTGNVSTRFAYKDGNMNGILLGIGSMLLPSPLSSLLLDKEQVETEVIHRFVSDGRIKRNTAVVMPHGVQSEIVTVIRSIFIIYKEIARDQAEEWT